MKERVTVDDVLKLVKKRRLEYYRFNKSGCGCLWWQFNFLNILIEMGWVKPRSTGELEEAIEKYREKGPRNRSLVPPAPGVDGKLLTEDEVKEIVGARSSGSQSRVQETSFDLSYRDFCTIRLYL